MGRRAFILEIGPQNLYILNSMRLQLQRPFFVWILNPILTS